jgi:hypothetical protein
MIDRQADKISDFGGSVIQAIFLIGLSVTKGKRLGTSKTLPLNKHGKEKGIFSNIRTD